MRPSSASKPSKWQCFTISGHFLRKNNLLQFHEIYFAGGRAKSPTKRVASRPPSASTASSSVAPSPAPVQGEAANKQSAASQNQQQQPPKRQRPSELIQNSIRETIYLKWKKQVFYQDPQNLIDLLILFIFLVFGSPWLKTSWMLQIWHNGVVIVLKSSLNLCYGGDFVFVNFQSQLGCTEVSKLFREIARV